MSYTAEQKEGYRRHKGLVQHDQLVRAQAIIRDAYYKAHPRMDRSMGVLPRGKDGRPLYPGKGPKDVL